MELCLDIFAPSYSSSQRWRRQISNRLKRKTAFEFTTGDDGSFSQRLGCRSSMILPADPAYSATVRRYVRSGQTIQLMVEASGG